jgi:hypothetical protein
VATASRPNPLFGMPLDYLIGADGPQGGTAGRITETPFGARPAAAGSSVAYCNLRCEDGEPDEFGPYLPHDDIFAQYKEGRPDPQGQGFQRNIVEQLDRCRQLGHTLVEEDNPDSYELPAVMLGIDLAQQRGLGVVAKNPGLMKDGAPTYVAHPNVFGIIVEKDCGTPAQMDDLRRNAGKPDLPVWFVSFGDNRSSARRLAKAITSAGFVNMGVTYSAQGEYESSEDILLPLARVPLASTPAIQPGEKPMADTVPAYLTLARSQIGKIEDGPSILPLAAKIAEIYPDLAGYCRLVTPTTSWCGLFCGHDLAVNGIRPPYNPKVDVQSFLFARAWLGFGTPVVRGQEQLGDILVFDFGGGDCHVTFYNGDGGSNYLCLGGNQSDQVKISSYPKSQCIGIRRPPGASSQPQILPSSDDAAFRPLLQKGAMGPDVSDLQRLLGVEVDGEFGPDTDAAVRSFQASHGLEVDGEVGPETWGSLLGKTPLKAAPGKVGTLTQGVIDQIVALARNSALARTSFPRGQGVAPIGYINGVAVTFARVYLKLKAQDSAALAMTAPIGASTTDVFAFLGLPGGDRPTMLRTLFALLYDLGMAESSGNCFEGIDQGASNVESDTAEAGLFQQSWNSHGASPEMPRLFAAYSANPDGLLSIFREGVHASSPSPDMGSGDGAKFQALCKSCPAFAVEFAAVGVRTIGGGPRPHGHWGTIEDQKVTIVPQAEQLLQQVQSLVDAVVPVVEVTPTTPTTHLPLPAGPLADILNRLKGLENIMNGINVPGPSGPSTTTTLPQLPQIDLARIEQDIARLGQIASTFSQFANTVGQIPTTGLPPQAAQIEQSISRLGQIAATLSQFATSLSGLAPAAGAAATATAPPVLSPIDKLLGGQALVGLKTPLAIGAYALMWIMQAAGNVGTATGDKATTTGSVLTALITAFGGLGVTAKFDRAFQAIGTISSVLQKLPGFPALPTTPPKP